MDFKDKTTAYGIMVQYGESARARTFLNNLTIQKPEHSDFVTVKNINLDYLANSDSYSVSSTDRNSLYNIGVADGFSSGYARSLYEVLTGERIEVIIPEVNVEGRSIENAKTVQPSILVYPNPVGDGLFNVSIDHLAKGEFCEMVITDATGQIKGRYAINENGIHHFEEENLSTGIYFLNIRDHIGQSLLQTKLVITN
jgi:Secretion system C-terminal sorting domain